MRAALVHYDVNRIANEPGNKTVMKHFGHMPNIQLLYVAAILEKLGVELLYVDVVGMRLSSEDVDKKLSEFNPDIIGLSVFTSHFHNARALAGHYKNILPGVKIMLGGVHTLIFPEETLFYTPWADFVCVGEAEMVLPEFVRRWETNESFSGMAGLVFRDGDKISYAGPPEPCRELDSVPFPARHLVPNEVYYNFISTRKNYTVVNTSRGCPFRCIFCEAAGSRWRARSAQNVAEEFEECHSRYNVKEIDIFDSSFTVSKKRVLDLCKILVGNGLNRKMIWDVRSRVDTVDEEMLEALREAGCYRIFYGIESGDKAVLSNLHKEISTERVEEIIRKTAKLGISPFGYFLVGSPGDTPESIRRTIDFAKKLPLDFAIFNCLTAFPKTELYEKWYLPKATKDFWADYIASSEPATEFMGRPWLDIDDATLRRTAHKAMLEYYFRPSQIFRAARSVKSAEQFIRYSKAAVDMALGFIRGGNA